MLTGGRGGLKKSPKMPYVISERSLRTYSKLLIEFETILEKFFILLGDKKLLHGWYKLWKRIFIPIIMAILLKLERSTHFHIQHQTVPSLLQNILEDTF